MKYSKEVELKNGSKCLLRNCGSEDGAAILEIFNKTHEETDFLLSYPDEGSFDVEKEAEFLKNSAESENAIEIAAFLGGTVVGTAGINPVGSKYKVKHRADFGISVLKDYWGLGIGRALMEACIECAAAAGYTQLELTAVADNENAIAMYKKAGFKEFGRDPRGFRSRYTGYQTLVYMSLDLENM